MKQKIRFWIGILFSAAGLALAIRTANIEETWSALTQANYYPLLPALAALAVTQASKAARWKLLFDPRYGHPPFTKVFSVLIIGQMVNLLFPLRMGEVARAYFIGEMTGTNKPLALGTVVVEKAVDMMAALILVVVLLLSLPFPDWLQRPVLSLALIASVLLIALFLLAHQRERLTGLLARISHFVPAALQPTFLREQFERTLDGLGALRNARTMLSVSVLTCIAWLTAAITNYFVFLALDINLPFIASVFLLVVLQVGVAVPSGPGRIGIFQYLTILALSIFAIAPEKAFAAGVVLYLLVHIPPIVLGLLFLWQYHFSLWRVKTIAGESET